MTKGYLKWALIPLLLAGGCVTTPMEQKQADFVDPALNRADIDHIYLYPFIDCRVGKKKKTNMDKVICPAARDFLAQWKYPVTMITNKTTTAQLAEMPTMDGIAASLPGLQVDPSQRWVMFFALLDSYNKVGFGSTGNAELVGFLFDTKEKKVVWREKSEGQAGQTYDGVDSLFMGKSNERQAVTFALWKIIATFPHDPTIPVSIPLL